MGSPRWPQTWLLTSLHGCLASTLLPVLLFACTPKTATKPVMDWRFEARQATKEVNVLPTLLLTPIDIAVDETTWVGAPLPYERAKLRGQRVASLAAIPKGFGWSLPGAIYEALEGDYQGNFHVGTWPAGAQDRAAKRLSLGQDIDPLLASLAHEGKGTGTLFTWIYWVKARPMTVLGPAGDMVDGPNGPVVLRFEEEPYWIDIRVGTALVAKDGEVIFRLIEQPAAVLGERGAEQTGWELARSVAAEIKKVWLVRPLSQDADADANK